MSVKECTQNDLSSQVSHTRILSQDRGIINISTLSNTRNTIEPTFRSIISVENVNSTGSLTSDELLRLGQKLEYYKSTIEAEEENLKQIEDECNQQQAQKLKKQKKATLVNQRYDKEYQSFCATEREKEAVINNIRKIQTKIDRLEDFHNSKKKESELLKNYAKMQGKDQKYNKFLSQLQKHQNENDIENKNLLMLKDSRNNHDMIKMVSNKNDKIIRNAKAQNQKDNRKKAVKLQIEKEFGMIKNIEHEKIKQQRVQTRQEEEADHEKRKIMTYRNKIDNCVKNKAGTQSSCSLIKLKEANYSKVYDIKMNVFKSIHPLGKLHVQKNSKNGSQSVVDLKKCECSADEVIGSWAEAISDPKLASEANKKMWQKFGHGMDWEKIHKCKNNRSSINKSMDANATKKHLIKLSRNFEGDVKGLPLLSQRTLKDIKNPKLSLKGSHFTSTVEEKDE